MSSQFDISDDIAGQAAEWVVRQAQDDGKHWEDLTNWLEAEQAHREAYNQAEMLWRELGEHQFALHSRMMAAGRQEAAARASGKNRSRALWLAGSGLAAAAGVILVVAVTWPRTLTYETRPGEQRQIALSDGSRITLNGGSRISVRMGLVRRVQLADAEAVFEVAHQPGRPFFVVAGETTVRDVGTVFSIGHDEGATHVAVVQGEVEVIDSARHSATHLVRGQVLDRDNHADAVRLSQVDPSTMAAWRHGQLIYQDQPLSRIAADLSRALPVPFQVAADARDIRFTGVLILDESPAVARRLEAFLPVSATRDGDHFEIRRRP